MAIAAPYHYDREDAHLKKNPEKIHDDKQARDVGFLVM
jgi:hypothetical protein